MVGFLGIYATLTHLQSPEKQKQNNFRKYMHYNVQCTYVIMYTSDLKKNISKMFQKYSKLCLPGQYGKVRRAGRYMSRCETKALYTTALQAAPTEGLTGDSDL
jgi:hypothetical protein